jgi:uracil-DNA glycosylase family 4
MSEYDDLLGRYVPGYGNPRAKLGIVGEAPGFDEAKEGIPFVGTTGRMLAESLKEAGIDIDDCYRTNVFKHFPGAARFDSEEILKINTGHTVQEGLPQLWEEINLPSVNCWLAVGDLALQTLTGKHGIFTWRGSILPSIQGHKKVIGTVHPAALFKTKGDTDKSIIPWRFWYIIKQDIYRAVEDSEFPELRLPVRQHGICRSSLQLEKFLEKGIAESPRYNGHVLASVDIEASHNIPITISIAFNSHEALSIALFNVGSWSAPGAGLTTGERIRIWRMLFKFFSNKLIKFIGQNFKYDHEKIENTLGFTIGRNRLHADVGLMSHVVQPEFRIALEFLTSIYTREPYYKDEGKEFDLSKDPLEQLMIYNDKDSMVTYEIYEKLLQDLEDLGLVDFYFNYKNKLHDFYMAMERTGFMTDEKQRSFLWDKYVKMYNDMDAEMKEVTGYHINPNSVPDVKWLLSQVGLPERKDTGKETISLLYANHAKDDKQKVACRNTLRMRSARKTMSQYIGVLPDFDGRVRSSWRIAGTETDRSATHARTSCPS